MELGEIVRFWSRFGRDEATGLWTHPDDRPALSGSHSFNLDFPASPYVGRVISAPVVILGANGGYSPTATPGEFGDETAVSLFMRRVRDPESSDWSNVAPYYDRVNYGSLIVRGEAVLVNAAPYRSPQISKEPDNRRVVATLPSSVFIRHWLLETLLPLAERGERLIVVKRPGMWQLTDRVKKSAGVHIDAAPISPHVTSAAWAATQDFLARRPGVGETGPQEPPESAPVQFGAAQIRSSTGGGDALDGATLAAESPQSDVEVLVHLCALFGLDLLDPSVTWRGLGKAIKLEGDRTIFINRKHADIRARAHEVEAWQKAGLGTVRPDDGTYLRVMYDGSEPAI